jgi:hypothetical protein
MNRKGSPIKPEFETTEEEINQMIDSLKEFGQTEVQKLSRAWIREIIIQPKNSKRRTFEYARGKLIKYLSWRRDNDISQKVDYHLPWFHHQHQHQKQINYHSLQVMVLEGYIGMVQIMKDHLFFGIMQTFPTLER